mgnify:CR=1 FL=1
MIVHGKYAPVVGRVCMDQLMIDVTDIPEAKMGDEVIVVGTDRRISTSHSTIWLQSLAQSTMNCLAY